MGRGNSSFPLGVDVQVLRRVFTAEERRLFLITQQGYKSLLELLWHYQERVSLYLHHSLVKMEVYVPHLAFAGIDGDGAPLFFLRFLARVEWLLY